MPVTRSDRTRGISIIWSARTQMLPTGSITAATVRSAGLSSAAMAAPARRPAMRARRTRAAEVVNVREVLDVLEVRPLYGFITHMREALACAADGADDNAAQNPGEIPMR